MPISYKSFNSIVSRKCVLFNVSKETQSLLTQYCLTNGFSITKDFSGETIKPVNFDFHVTIMYSENEQAISNAIIPIPEIIALPLRFDLLGKENDVPVIIIDINSQMQKYRNHYQNFYGLTDKWPEWKAHLSLSYDYNGQPDLKNLSFPEFPIVLDSITVSEVT